MDKSFVRDILRGSSGIIINKRLIKYLGGDVSLAFFISDLMDRDNYFESLNDDYDDWFYSTKSRRSEEYGMSDKMLQRLMSRAISGNFVETKTAGNPSKQWIKIKYDNISQLISRVDGNVPARVDGNVPARVDGNVPPLNSHTNSHLKKHTVTGQKNNLPKTTGTGRGKAAPIITSVHSKALALTPPEAKPLASYLANIVISHINVNIPPQKISGWTIEIVDMILKDGLTPDRIEKALGWYKDNIGRKYVPVIQSGSSLRQKFLSLEAAVLRGSENEGRKKPSQSSHEKPDNEKFLASIQHKIIKG